MEYEWGSIEIWEVKGQNRIKGRKNHESDIYEILFVEYTIKYKKFDERKFLEKLIPSVIIGDYSKKY